ncbi:MAG: hypothetical protein RR177_00955 [Oscillospiraceae bacterium]
MMESILKLNQPVSSWLWNISYYTAYPNDMLRFCKKNGVKRLYLSIHYAVTNINYCRLIEFCAKSGIEAVALIGDAPWVIPTMRTGFFEELDRICEINRLCGKSAKFEAVHVDVEPYTEPVAMQLGGGEKYVPYLTDFIEEASNAIGSRGLRAEFDIPGWFYTVKDEQGGCTLAETVFKLSDVVCIMAYRDSADEQLKMIMPNLEFAKKYNRSLIIGSETLNTDEARRSDGNSVVSYFEEGKEYMYRELSQIEHVVSETYDNFGFAIHDISHWMALSQEPLF